MRGTNRKPSDSTRPPRSTLSQQQRHQDGIDPAMFEPEWEPDPDDIRDREIELKVELEIERRREDTKSSQPHDDPVTPTKDPQSTSKSTGWAAKNSGDPHATMPQNSEAIARRG